MTDCLVIGYNEGKFEEDVKRMKAMGEDSISFKDFNLGYITHQNKNYRALDAMTHFHYEGSTKQKRVFHNADVLWQVIMYLGTYLSKNNFSFDYVNLFHFEKEKLKQKLQKEDIKAIVVTTTIYVSVHPVLEVIEFIRKYNKTAKIIVGGPYISKQCEEVDVSTNQSMFKLIDADFYINSLEGEKTLVELLRQIKGDEKYSEVNNIAYRDGEEYIFTSTSSEGNSLEDNMIDFSLFPKQEIGKTINIRTAKSCPFSCAYCGFPLRAEKYSYISVERVEKELNELKALGCIEYINFIDDTFNIPKTRYKEILRMMIKNKYNFKWYSFYRCDFGDEETIRLMKEAGCIGAFLGVESANDGILKTMNKTSRVKDYLKAIKTLQEEEIMIFVSTIIGFPGETYKTAMETMDFIEATKPDFFRPQIFWSDPLTPIWQKREKYGLKGLGFNWVHNTMDAKTAYDLFEENFLSVENSLWAPDPGFNAYGMYYLMERGMKIGQVKDFLRGFNTIVKEQILFPHQKDISMDLLKSFSNICKYDVNKDIDMTPINILAGSEYKKAKEYWLKQLEEGNWSFKKKSSSLSQITSTSSMLYDDLKDLKDEDLTNVLLSTYSVLLSKLFAIEDISLAVANNHVNTIPILLHIDDSNEISSIIQKMDYKLKNGSIHSLYGINILKSSERMKLQNATSPSFSFAYIEGCGDLDKLENRLTLDKKLCNDIGMIMYVNKAKGNIEIKFKYTEEWLYNETIDQIGEYFETIFNEMKAISQKSVGEISITMRKEDSWINEIKNQEFNF